MCLDFRSSYQKINLSHNQLAKLLVEFNCYYPDSTTRISRMTPKPGCMTPKPHSRKLSSRKIQFIRGFGFIAYKQALHLFIEKSINLKSSLFYHAFYLSAFYLFALQLFFTVFIYSPSFKDFHFYFHANLLLHFLYSSLFIYSEHSWRNLQTHSQGADTPSIYQHKPFDHYLESCVLSKAGQNILRLTLYFLRNNIQEENNFYVIIIQIFLCFIVGILYLFTVTSCPIFYTFLISLNIG